MPPNPGEFLETGAFASVLAQLRARGDIVLIDAPPLLHIGDSLTLSAKVDALFLVVRHNILKRPLLNELRRVLDVAPAAKLGFCLTGVETADEYGYGSYYGRQYVESPQSRSTRRSAAKAL
jgi:receptor protein-tyrosine kinase